jgi:SAM-dependent methyltransferase
MLMEKASRLGQQSNTAGDGACDPDARQRALALCTTGDVTGARQALAALLAKWPNDAELLGDIAAVSYSQNDYTAAIQFARAALAIDKSSGPSALTLGMALAAGGKAREAADVLNLLNNPTTGADFQRRWPDLAAMARDQLQRLREPAAPGASLAVSSDRGFPNAPALGTYRNLREFVWGDIDPFITLPSYEAPDGVVGWYSDHPIFRKVISEQRPRRIVEVGTLFGASAIHCAKLLREFAIDGEITCVDTFLGSTESYFEFREDRANRLSAGRLSFLDEFLGNVKAAGVSDYINPFPQTSTCAARAFKMLGVKFDMIYLDASHDYVDVLADLREWWPLLADGGILLGDDFEDPWYDVIWAVKQFSAEIGKPLGLARAFASSPAGGRENTKFYLTK